MSTSYLIRRDAGTMPSPDHVAGVLATIGGKSNALDLCNALVLDGHTTKDSQLAMQRAVDTNHILLMNDWTYQLPTNPPPSDRMFVENL